MTNDYFRGIRNGTIVCKNFYLFEYISSVLAAKTDNLEPFTAFIKGFVELMVILLIFANFLKGGS
ncbi:MAG: hypothetical protein ABI855_17795 [Bacteroidota bacterium]